MNLKKEISKTIILIPARLGSKRLPKKVIKKINGTPLIVHVANRIVQMNIGKVVVASGDKQISEILDKFKITSHLTLGNHKSGSDRIFEIFNRFYKSYEIIVNLQGDMPYFSKEIIVRTIDLIKNKGVDIATSAIKLKEKEKDDANVVKVKVKINKSKEGYAEDFLRTFSCSNDLYHHIGIYVYKSKSLKRFVNLKQTKNEKVRKLEQMRALDNNLKIKVALTNDVPMSVDTNSDLRKIRYFFKKYIKSNV